MIDYYYPGCVNDLLPDLLGREEDYSITITVMEEEKLPDNLTEYDPAEDVLEHGDRVYFNEVPDWFVCEFTMFVDGDVWNE